MHDEPAKFDQLLGWWLCLYMYVNLDLGEDRPGSNVLCPERLATISFCLLSYTFIVLSSISVQITDSA